MSARRPAPWSPGPRPPSWSSRTPGPDPSWPPSTAPAGSSSPAVASLPKTSSPRSTRPRPTPKRGRPMPGLLRGVARTAVIAGTATSVSNRVSKRQGERWAAQEQQQYAQQAPPPQAAPAAPAGGGSSTIDQLKELGELKAQGILTEEEF